MNFNWLLLAGYVYRTADKYFNRDFPFSWSDPVGKKNIKVSIFNAMLIGLVFYLSFFIYPEKQYEVWKYMIAYFAIGWFVDSFFGKLLEVASKLYDKILGKVNNKPTI